MNHVVFLLPESKVLRKSAKFPAQDTYPGCRVVIQTYFSASSTSFSWDVWVCACAVKVNGLPRSFTPNSSQSTHTATLTLSKTVCPSQALLLFQREGGKQSCFSPFHLSAGMHHQHGGGHRDGCWSRAWINVCRCTLYLFLVLSLERSTTVHSGRKYSRFIITFFQCLLPFFLTSLFSWLLRCFVN